MEKCCNAQLEWKTITESGAEFIIEETMCSVCKSEYQKKKGKEFAYKTIKGGDETRCTFCGSKILLATVAHAIHNGPFKGSGSGKCDYEEIPYCPKCEEKPKYHGKPIVPF